MLVHQSIRVICCRNRYWKRKKQGCELYTTLSQLILYMFDIPSGHGYRYGRGNWLESLIKRFLCTVILVAVIPSLVAADELRGRLFDKEKKAGNNLEGYVVWLKDGRGLPPLKTRKTVNDGVLVSIVCGYQLARGMWRAA